MNNVEFYSSETLHIEEFSFNIHGYGYKQNIKYQVELAPSWKSCPVVLSYLPKISHKNTDIQ